MTRRRAAVCGAILAAVGGEWLGHGLAYYRAAGLPGLYAGLGGGVHDYMLPLGIAIVVAGFAGAALWLRAWTALGRRFDNAVRLVRQVQRGRVTGAVAARRSDPASPRTSAVAAIAALALPLAALQVVLFLVQENAERAVHGLPLAGIAPIAASGGAAAWIQVTVALVVATLLMPLFRALDRRLRAARRHERLARALLLHLARPPARPTPVLPVLRPAHLRQRAALWRGPPQVAAST